MKSMTAFARAENTGKDISFIVEIRSYNSKNLDIALRMPFGYVQLEEKIKELVATRINRGRIELNVRTKENGKTEGAYQIDMPKAEAFYSALGNLKDAFRIEGEITLDLLMQSGDFIRPVEIERDMEECWTVLKGCLVPGLDDLIKMRMREGDFIKSDFTKRFKFIETCIDKIKKESKGLLSYYQKRLMERISSLTDGQIEPDPVRIAQEAAIFADRSDISEEITRAKSHIKQFRHLMNGNEPSGRKLNFLLQEFFREFNTIGSKTGNATVSHTVVELKAELEKIREQVQNVE